MIIYESRALGQRFADLHAQLAHALGHLDVSKSLGLGTLGKLFETDHLHATGKDQGERPLYRNRIDAIRSTIPYRSLRSDQHGQLLHPKPTVAGQQSAIVVGSADNVIYTDRDHRIKLQFHWQRGTASNHAHSRLAHPQADGHKGAPANEQAGTWVRGATSLALVAGANWGSNAIPRIGQEVVVDFIDGDIDRPVVIGSLYNGKGNLDGQYNQVASGSGVATGNAPNWFPGEKEVHAHPASLSGIKSQSMSTSGQGTGAYNQLVFDDSPEQIRTSLQQHAVAHQGTAELNLGHLRHQSDNQRLNSRWSNVCIENIVRMEPYFSVKPIRTEIHRER
ncbi:phage baseplate assembly protein V [Undibacterium sp.]|uniref:phage baseplate assembly protein V n=1 Tax=Undibacterium sp. TaxID=1914977 RepID=UPI00345C53AF